MQKGEEQRINDKGNDLTRLVRQTAKTVFPNHIVIVIEPEDDLLVSAMNDESILARFLTEKGEVIKLKKFIFQEKDTKQKFIALDKVASYVYASLLKFSKVAKKIKIKKS